VGSLPSQKATSTSVMVGSQSSPWFYLQVS
jgi:hypothetical protein